MRFTRPLRLVPLFVASLLFGALAPTVSASAAVPVCADLQVQSFTVSPTTPIAGQQAVIHVTVHNGGTCTAFGATLQWKITPFATSGPSVNTGSIAAGATPTFDLPYTFLKAGNFESIAIIDTKNVVSETNEKNNTKILPVTVLAAGIDLSVKSITTTPDAPVASGYPNDPVQGRNETTTIVVHNGGNTAAGPFQRKWVPKPFAPAVTYQFSGLPANSDSSGIPFSYTYQQTGTFTSTATVDATNLVKETNEKNNTLTKSVKVDPQLSDLIINSVQVSPAPYIPGGLTTFTITVKNQGNSPSGASILSWRPQPLAAPVSTQVGPLQPNQVSDPVQLQFTYARAGSFAGLITADSTKVVPELNENNNTSPTNVVVSPNTVDLQIADETITGSQQEQINSPAALTGTVNGTPTQGEPVTVDITVLNAGNTHSGPFLVDWNPDANYVTSPSLQTVTKEVTDLGAGQTTHVIFTFTYPVYGNFSTLTTLDPRNQVAETNEANNQLIVPITVAPAQIDLTVSLNVDPNPAVRGVATTATVTVTNSGQDFPASKPFTVQWFPTGTGGPAKSQVVQGLSPNSSTTLTFTNTYPTATKANQPYNSVAVVDSGNTIPETDENNNTSNTVQVTVVPQSTDVTVSLDHEIAFNSMEFTSGAGCIVDGEDCGTGEYYFIYLVFDPTTNCDINITTGDSNPSTELKIPKFYCATQRNNGVSGDGSTPIGSPLTHQVHLVEQSPLVAGVGDLEIDKHIPDVPGVSLFLATKDQYRTQSGLVKTAGQQCNHLDSGGAHPIDNGHCFDAYWGVHVDHDNAPTSGSAFAPVAHSTAFKAAAMAAAADTTDPSDGSWTQDEAVTAMNDAFAQIQAVAAAAAQQAGVPTSQVHISVKNSTGKAGS